MRKKTTSEKNLKKENLALRISNGGAGWYKTAGQDFKYELFLDQFDP